MKVTSLNLKRTINPGHMDFTHLKEYKQCQG